MDNIYLEVTIMKVKDIMSKEIACLNSEDSIQKAAEMMKEHDIGSIPVCNQNKIIGIVTDRDITLRTVATAQNPTQQKVGDIMTSNPVVGRPEMDVDDAVSIMSHRQIRRLPIVENDSLVGIVSLGDISVEPMLQHDAETALNNISQPYGTPM
jgi:CBS domain-containing protein